MKLKVIVLLIVSSLSHGCATTEPLPPVDGPKAYLVAKSKIQVPKPYDITHFTYNPNDECVRTKYRIDNKTGTSYDETHSLVEVSAAQPVYALTIFSRIGSLGCWVPYRFVPSEGSTYYFVTESDGGTCSVALSKDSMDLTEESYVESLPVVHDGVTGKVCPDT